MRDAEDVRFCALRSRDEIAANVADCKCLCKLKRPFLLPKSPQNLRPSFPREIHTETTLNATPDFVQCKRNPEFMRMLVDIASKNMSENFLKNYEEVKNDFKICKSFALRRT